MLSPTNESYDAISAAYDHFNKELFDGKLPPVLISYQRGNFMGYASQKRWVDHKGAFLHELAMNPSYFAGQAVEEVLSTLLHECVHIYQFEHGKPGRGRYHNAEWSKLMSLVGLVATNDGWPEGKQTGDRMTHYILHDGPAFRVIRKMVRDGYQIPWLDRQIDTEGATVRIFDTEFRPRGLDDEILGEPFSRARWKAHHSDATGGQPLTLAKGTPGAGELLPPWEDESTGDKGAADALSVDQAGNHTSVIEGGPDDNKDVISGAAQSEEDKGPEPEPIFFRPNATPKKKNPSRITYRCPREGCKNQVLGRPGLMVGCYCEHAAGLFTPKEDN